MLATNIIANTRRSSAHYQPCSLGSHRRHLVFQTMSAFQQVCRQTLTGEDQTIVSFGTLGRQYCRRQAHFRRFSKQWSAPIQGAG